MRLGFLTDPKGKVPVKVVARTFASGKAEKLVYQCLSDLGLPSGKVILILLL
jgi:phosphatidylinositol phospholipase C beta